MLPMSYSKEEERILRHYFTNTDQNTFCLTNLPEVIKGTLFSRYSRTAKDLRRLFLDEFMSSTELAGLFSDRQKVKSTPVNVAKAEDFYERILVGYGDDSVAELGGTHVAVENISMLATKSIEEHRLGLSPLEKSTRYVYYDKKIDGEYMFYTDPKIKKSKYANKYYEVMNLLFSTYSTIVRDIQPILKKVYPGDEADRAYVFSIRAKACDLARGLLPLSAVTNMGVYGNGRAFEYLLITLFADPLHEVQSIAGVMNDNLRQVIPAFVKRASNERGKTYQEYLKNVDQNVTKLVTMKHASLQRHQSKYSVKLAEFDKHTVEKIIAAIIYQKSEGSYKDAYTQAATMPARRKEEILKSLRAHRLNRHHKLPRAAEEAMVAFDITADWGVYKDLMRHRILTRHRQLFTNELGYILPEEIASSQFKKPYCEAMDRATELYSKLKKIMPHEAQYAVTHGSYNRFYLKMNIREAVHLAELRSTPQGHPTYRKVAQDIAIRIGEKMPLIQKYLFPFVDYKDYELERLSSFKKIAAKADKFGVKGFED